LLSFVVQFGATVKSPTWPESGKQQAGAAKIALKH